MGIRATTNPSYLCTMSNMSRYYFYAMLLLKSLYQNVMCKFFYASQFKHWLLCSKCQATVTVHFLSFVFLKCFVIWELQLFFYILSWYLSPLDVIGEVKVKKVVNHMFTVLANGWLSWSQMLQSGDAWFISENEYLIEVSKWDYKLDFWRLVSENKNWISH